MKLKSQPESFELKTGKEYFPFDLQRFADPPAGDPPADDLVEVKDPVSGKTIKVSKEFSIILGHTISKTREETKSSFDPLMKKVESLESEKEEFQGIKQELEKLKLQSMTAEQIAQENAKRVIAEHERKAKDSEAKAEAYKSKYEKVVIRNEIYGSFTDTKLCNPEQVAMLFEAEGRAKIVPSVDNEGKPTGEDEVRVSLTIENEKTKELEKMEGTPKELFKKWIKMERNAHHILNDIGPGGGTPPRGKGKPGGVNYDGLSAVDKLNKAREQQGGRAK